MAQMLHLELTADATPVDHLTRRVQDTATRTGALSQVVGGATPDHVTFTLTTGVRVSISRPVVSAEDPFVADFGMARAATIDFILDSRYDLDAQYDQLLQMVFALLAVVPGDAVVHYDYAEVWLVRRGGQVVVNTQGGMWPPERLARIPVPYQQAPLQFVSM